MQKIFQKELTASLQRHSQRIAIEDNGRLVSYSGLLSAANKVTRFLQSQEVVRESIIGIMIDDRTDLVTCITGVANAGCVFVPIDASLPDKRLVAILRELKCRLVISSRKHELKTAFNAMPTLKRYSFEHILEQLPETDDLHLQYPEYREDDSLYIYFTSGTTGQPKGIIGKNSSLLQFLQWEITAFGIDSTSRCSQFISPYFDAFLRDVFVPLLSGGTVCIPPARDDFFTPEKMVDWIDEHRITMIHCVPSIFRIFNRRDLTQQHFRSLEYVFLSGERIIPAELKSWFEIFEGRIKLFNLYGATETTMIRAYYEINFSDTQSERIPIGKPISDTELIIVNEGLKACGTMVIGDLYIVSDYISKGYLNNLKLTKELFVKLPAASLQAMAFKTGDKARKLPNGMIDLLGRGDNQVKLRGIRVELSEIENALLMSKYVSSAVCSKITADNGEDALVAFIIRDPELPAGFSILPMIGMYLEKHLPSYMIPSKVIETSVFPLLSNGKIDHKSLIRQIAEGNIIAPENELQEQLLEIWKELLGDYPISIDDSFQSKGGNSLSMMRLIGRIYNRFTIRITLAQLFGHLTIRKQAVLIAEVCSDNVFRINPASETAFYNLSQAQERIYYSCQLDKSSTVYNMPMAWEIAGVYDRFKIESVLKHLIARHESLRTGFKIENGNLCQVIAEQVDFSLLETEMEEGDLQQTISAAVRPFDLSEPPLIRASVLLMRNGTRILLIDIHHIICDGISEFILGNEFMQLYQGRELAATAFQYKDYAEWEHQFTTTSEYLRSREFWLNMFEGELPVLALPSVSKHIKEVNYEGGSIDFEIDRHIIDAIAAECSGETITRSSVLYAVFFVYLSQLTGQKDLTVGLAVSGRSQYEIEHVVGMFVKTLAVRYQLNIHMSFSSFVTELHKLLVEANSHQHYDLVSIMDELNKSRETPVKSLFSALFAFQNYNVANDAYTGNDFPPVVLDSTTSKYPLSLIVNEMERNYLFRLEYASLYFTREDAQLLAENFKLLTVAIAAGTEGPLINTISGSNKVRAQMEDDIVFDFADE